MAIRYLIFASVSAGALFAGTAQAQQTAQADNAAAQPPTNAPPAGGAQPAPTDTGEGSNIVVTGFRRSIAASIRAKRNSAVIADILTAEDIGKFPDKNVAEALQRIPGVVINREFGEGERVSVRGTATNLTKTLLNGHNVATADWFILDQLAATRAFNYLTLPSEVVGELEVYKSPEADIEEGGVGATVNVHTRNPLDLKALTISASAQTVYSERSKKWDPQLSGIISWKNSSNTFGVLAALVYEKRRIRRDGVEVLGYFTQADNPATPANEDVSNGALMPSLIGSALFQQERERYGGNVAVQFKPSDALEINLTGLYTRFNANNFNQNFLAWGSNAIGGGGTLTNPTVVDGTVVAGTITSTPGGRGVVYDAIDRIAYSASLVGRFRYDLAAWRAVDGPPQGRLHRGARQHQGAALLRRRRAGQLHLRPSRPHAAGDFLRDRSNQPQRPQLRLCVAAQDHQQRQGEATPTSTSSSRCQLRPDPRAEVRCEVHRPRSRDDFPRDDIRRLLPPPREPVAATAVHACPPTSPMG